MRHSRVFADGAMSEEAAVLLIEAYLQLGDQRLARARLAAYDRAHPDGVLRGRVATLRARLDDTAPPPK